MIKYIVAGGFALLMFVIVAVVSIRPNIQGFERVDLIQPDESITVVGYRTIYTMEKLIDILLTKPGGYISNDKLPPFSFMDDMPAWEEGAISVLRENSIAIRRHFTRSVGAQSVEDKDAVGAQVNINIDTESWMFPSVEGWFWSTGRYEVARNHYANLVKRLTDENPDDGNFYARATSFSDALDAYRRILGSLSQRLSASVGGINLPSTTGDRSASEAKTTNVSSFTTPWLEIDDVFWEAQGAAWALEELFDALEYDFYTVLKDKNAVLTVKQIREELKRAQEVVPMPYTFNGGGYGPYANHSLILSNYISRASATMVDLKKLIDNG